MSELRTIQAVLEAAASRRRWQRAWTGFWSGLALGSSFWLLILVLYKIFPLPQFVLGVGAVVALAAMAAGFLAGALKKPTLEETARWLDSRQQLKERLSTAWEMSAQPATAGWQTLLVHDAAVHAQQLDPRRMLPFGLPPVTRWALILLVLGAGVGFVPEHRSEAYRQRQAEGRNIQDTGKILTEVTRRNLSQRPPVFEPTQKALDQVQELGEQLAKAKLTRSEALRELANMSEKLKEQTAALRNDPALRRLEQAARTPGGNTLPTAADMQRQIDALQKELGGNNPNPEDIGQLQRDLQQLQQAAAAMAQAGAAGAQAAKEQMARALSDLAQSAQEMGLNLPGLEEAIQSLEAGQIDRFLKDLQALDLDLEKLAALSKAMQNLQMQLAQLGRTLAEQLEKGQGPIAHANLHRMIKQLQSGGLTPEQLQKILEEVQKAVQPGSQYGKVGEFLQKAAGEMQQGQKNQAAASLAAAARELEQLMDQMGDCQQLLAALENLRIAQLCIGTCQGWGLCMGSPGFKPGGRPGRGVGTWADDNGWQSYAEMTGLWDNTGITQPEMDPRGLTDRGEGELSEALRPDRVKGRFSPGGQMPSITLKGVSIKGESKVAYEEAVAAAQVEAQSALSQDQVPRAYQGTVRDYFDDLKK